MTHSNPLLLLSIPPEQLLKLRPEELIKKKRELLIEFDLNEDKMLETNGIKVSKDDAIRAIEELEKKIKQNYFAPIAEDKKLLHFLRVGDIDFFTDNEKFIHHSDPYFLHLIRPFFIQQLDKALLLNFKQENATVFTSLLEKNLFKEKKYHHQVFKSISERLNLINDFLFDTRAKVAAQQASDIDKISKRTSSLVSIDCLNLLPDEFRKKRRRIAQLIADIALYLFKKYNNYSNSKALFLLADEIKGNISLNNYLNDIKSELKPVFKQEKYEKLLLNDEKLNSFLQQATLSFFQVPQYRDYYQNKDFLHFIKDKYIEKYSQILVEIFKAGDVYMLKSLFSQNLFSSSEVLEECYDKLKKHLFQSTTALDTSYNEMLEQKQQTTEKFYAFICDFFNHPVPIKALNVLPKEFSLCREKMVKKIIEIAEKITTKQSDKTTGTKIICKIAKKIKVKKSLHDEIMNYCAENDNTKETLEANKKTPFLNKTAKKWIKIDKQKGLTILLVLVFLIVITLFLSRYWTGV